MASQGPLANKPDLVKLLYFLKEATQIVGRTKFQKLVFLAKQEEALDIGFEFIRYNYGPYSFEMSQALDALQQIGLISISEQTVLDENDNPMSFKTFTYSLTEDGGNVVEQSKIDDDSLNKIKKVIDKWNMKSRTEIINYVYSKYMNS